jgi:hypothetical protein
MFAPKSVTAAQNAMPPELKAMEARAIAAQKGALGVSDEEAEQIISEYNRQPGAVQIISRASYKAKYSR